jgi:hypothetical protein
MTCADRERLSLCVRCGHRTPERGKKCCFTCLKQRSERYFAAQMAARKQARA